jgi:hypothetical protein
MLNLSAARPLHRASHGPPPPHYVRGRIRLPHFASISRSRARNSVEVGKIFAWASRCRPSGFSLDLRFLPIFFSFFSHDRDHTVDHIVRCGVRRKIDCPLGVRSPAAVISF